MFRSCINNRPDIIQTIRAAIQCLLRLIGQLGIGQTGLLCRYVGWITDDDIDNLFSE